MAKNRYLAPWHRKSLDANALDSMSVESVDLLANLEGKPAIYHCMSRIVNREADRTAVRDGVQAELALVDRLLDVLQGVGVEGLAIND